MTDEEMAEEYTSNLLKSVNCNIGNPGARQINSIDVKDGFLAGLKAGRSITKWHDLRKNPNDLPKEFDLIRKAFGSYPAVVSPHIVLNQDGERVCCRRHPENKHQAWYWFYASDDLGLAPNPTAWCEIPKFEEEPE